MTQLFSRSVTLGTTTVVSPTFNFPTHYSTFEVIFAINANIDGADTTLHIDIKAEASEDGGTTWYEIAGAGGQGGPNGKTGANWTGPSFIVNYAPPSGALGRVSGIASRSVTGTATANGY